MIVRSAEPAEISRVATLHAERISEGFLPTLGRPFLERLYRRVLASPDAFVLVVEDRGAIVGFAAAAADLGALYKRFVLRDGVIAGIRAAPRILRSIGRVTETLRYPSVEEGLPEAEILAVAVDASAGGQGIGHALVDAATERLRDLGVTEVKVVTGAANEAALRLYRGCGYATRARIAVHEGSASEVLVWTAQ